MHPILSEYHASQDTVLGVTLVPVSGNNLMNGHESGEREGVGRMPAFKTFLEVPLASIAYTLDVKYNTHSAIF